MAYLALSGRMPRLTRTDCRLRRASIDWTKIREEIVTSESNACKSFNICVIYVTLNRISVQNFHYNHV